MARDDKARIRANIERMIAAGASEADIEEYLSIEGVPATGPAAASGAPQARVATENATELDGIQDTTWGQRFGGTLVSGLATYPAGQAAMAAIRSVARRQPYQEALSDIQTAMESAPTAGRAIAGGAGLVSQIPLLPARVLRGGRVAGTVAGGVMSAAHRLGGAEGESLADRLRGTLASGVAGGVVGAIAPWLTQYSVPRTVLGAGIGGYAGSAIAPEGRGLEGGFLGAVTGGTAAASPSKTAGLLGTALERMKAPASVTGAARSIKEATGLRGRVNVERQGIQDLLPPGVPIGVQDPAAQIKIAELAKNRARNERLYSMAKQDKAILNDPEVVSLIQDPDIVRAFGAVAKIRKEAGSPLPSVVTGSRAVPSPILSPRGQPFVRQVPTVAEVPDPEGLHLLKRIVQETTDRQFQGERVIPVEDAIRIAPKLERLRGRLHDLSPAYKRADNAFQVARVGEEAFEAGMTAAGPAMQDPAASKVGVSDVSGLARSLQETRKARILDPAQQARVIAATRRGQQLGARAKVAQQLTAQGVLGGRRGVLEAPVLAASGPAAQQRGLAGIPGYEQTIQRVREEAGAATPHYIALPIQERMVASAAQLFRDPITKPAAQRMLGETIVDPRTARLAMERARAGSRALTGAERLAQAFGKSTLFPADNR